MRPHVHGPNCFSELDTPIYFAELVHSIEWAKAIDKRSGVEVRDYIILNFEGKKIRPGTNEQETFEVAMAIDPAGAIAIVRAIERLVSGPPPPNLNMPGRN